MTRKGYHRSLDWKNFFDSEKNFLRCDICPNNEGYGEWNGRLPCGAWKCSVKRPANTIGEKEGTTGSVFVTARMGAHQMSFESAISKDYDINTGEIRQFIHDRSLEDERFAHVIVCEPFRYNDQILSFANPYNTLRLSCIRNVASRPFGWEHVAVEKVRVGDEYVHLVASKDEGKGFNRRGNFRVDVTQDGTAQIGENKAGRDIIVTDMSATGIGFTVTSEVDISLGDRIRLTFSDSVDEPSVSEKHEDIDVMSLYKPGKTIKHKYNFILTGSVVRFLPLSNGKTQKVGCSFDNAVDRDRISKYIYAKQRGQIGGRV